MSKRGRKEEGKKAREQLGDAVAGNGTKLTGRTTAGLAPKGAFLLIAAAREAERQQSFKCRVILSLMGNEVVYFACRLTGFLYAYTTRVCCGWGEG